MDKGLRGTGRSVPHGSFLQRRPQGSCIQMMLSCLVDINAVIGNRSHLFFGWQPADGWRPPPRPSPGHLHTSYDVTPRSSAFWPPPIDMLQYECLLDSGPRVGSYGLAGISLGQLEKLLLDDRMDSQPCPTPLHY